MFLLLRPESGQDAELLPPARLLSPRALAALLFLALIALAAPLWAANSGGTSCTAPASGSGNAYIGSHEGCLVTGGAVVIDSGYAGAVMTGQTARWRQVGSR